MKRRTRGTTAMVAFWLLFAALAMAMEESPGVVNINTATAEQLTWLPRVGPALAQRIIEFRESNGRFKSTEELILVRGIGEGTYELLEDYVTVEGATTLKEEVPSPRSRDQS